MSKKRTPMKPHLYSLDLEYAVLNLYRKAVASESKALRLFLADCMDEGVTEDEIMAAYAEFSNDPKKASNGVRYFKAFLRTRVSEGIASKTKYSEAF